MNRKRKLPDTAFWIAQDRCRPVFTDPSGRQYPDAAEEYYKLLLLVSEKLTSSKFAFDYTDNATRSVGRMIPRTGHFYPRGSEAQIHSLPRSQQDVFDALFLETQKAVREAYRRGVEHGQSLLLRLAEGKITNKELNAATVNPRDSEQEE